MRKKIGIYIRTVDDISENISIIKQRTIINDFLDKHLELANYDRIEFVDCGYSGLNMNRPSFCEMLKKAKSGEITAICVNSLCRVSRNLLIADKFITDISSKFGVRIIVVETNYDSISPKQDYIITGFLKSLETYKNVLQK